MSQLGLVELCKIEEGFSSLVCKRLFSRVGVGMDVGLGGVKVNTKAKLILS